MTTVVHHRSWAATLTILAVTACLAVGVIYIPQAMLVDMAIDLGVSPSATGTVVTAAQVGYAVGIFLFVPLADKVHPRRQVTVQSVALALALACAAILPTIAAAAICFLIVGLVANIAQVLIPAVNRMAPEGRSASAMGTMVGALLFGVFGGRILAGTLVESVGWRCVVLIFAASIVASVPFSRRALDAPWSPPAASAGYLALLGDTLKLVRRSRVLVESTVLQYFMFAVFTSLWSVIVLHLTAEPFDWTVRQAALFGFVGLAATITTPIFSRGIDRFGSMSVIGISFLLCLTSTLTAIFWSDVMVPLAIAMFVVTAANQAIHAANQNQVLAANPDKPARANTLFMVGVFMGGSTGAIVGSVAYELEGMLGVTISATILTVAGTIGWLCVTLRRSRKTESQSCCARSQAAAEPDDGERVPGGSGP
jgi:predicted MFS family arabinose efflux permease